MGLQQLHVRNGDRGTELHVWDPHRLKAAIWKLTFYQDHVFPGLYAPCSLSNGYWCQTFYYNILFAR